MKYLTTLTTMFFFTDYTHSSFISLTTLTALFYFTAIKMKYLTQLNTLFFFTDYTHYAVFPHWLHSLCCFSSLTTHSQSCFTSLLLKWNIWLCSLRYFSLLIALTSLFFFTDCTHYAVFLHWLYSLRCFSSLTTLTKLFSFTDYTHYADFFNYY